MNGAERQLCKRLLEREREIWAELRLCGAPIVLSGPQIVSWLRARAEAAEAECTRLRALMPGKQATE